MATTRVHIARSVVGASLVSVVHVSLMQVLRVVEDLTGPDRCARKNLHSQTESTKLERRGLQLLKTKNLLRGSLCVSFSLFFSL
jgi:hypothetical protein